MKGMMGGLVCGAVSALIVTSINQWGVPFQHWEETFRLQPDGRWLGGIEGIHLNSERLPAELISKGEVGDKLVWNYSGSSFVIVPLRYDRYRLYRGDVLLGHAAENLATYYLVVALLGAVPGLFLWCVVSRFARSPQSPVTP